MAPWDGVLAMTMVVRDEEDVLAANLDYHLAQGVDVVLVVDHGSSDRTPEVLSEYQRTGRVHVFREEDRAHDQVRRVNWLTKLAAEEHGADWIIHADADEFWMPAAGRLRDVFAGIPDRYGWIQVERNDFVPVTEDGRPFHQRMIIRERRSLNLRGGGLEPKVAQRPGAAASVTAGNHELEGAVTERAADIGAIQIGHFPLRTWEQFERKVVKTGVGYEELEGRGEGIGIDQIELLRMQRSGELRAYYDERVVDLDRLDDALQSRDLVIDDRLRTCLDGRGEHLEESPWVQEMRTRAWLEIGAISDLRQELEDHARRLDILRAQEVADLMATIEAIKSSRIMRFTAAARRLYYRVRPAGRRRR